MRTLLIGVILIATAFFSCQKEKQQPVNRGLIDITGKWQVEKVTTYLQDSTGNKIDYTTYQQPLANANYVQFNADSTCVWSTDHYYAFSGPDKVAVPQNTFQVLNFRYAQAQGSTFKFYLTGPLPPIGPQPPTGPAAIYEEEAASISAGGTLTIHSVIYNNFEKSQVVYDTYYTR